MKKIISNLSLLLMLISSFTVGEQIKIPRLVIYIVVDGMREDSFDLFGDLYIGGLKYLHERGIYYEEAYHAHAYSATSPGHFVLGSGRYPGPAGVLGNDWYNRILKKKIYSVGDLKAEPLSGKGNHVSYRNIPANAIGDWIKIKYPKSKVFSIGGKDRSTIMLGGKNPDGVFWLDFKTGEFVTTSYYMTEYPQWLVNFNSLQYPKLFSDSTWNRILKNQAIYVERTREDDFPPESSSDKRGDTSFPHNYNKINPNEEVTFYELWNFPWVDHIILDLAKEAIEEEQLGRDENPDLLCIALSMVDGIGHHFGPFSHEAMDTYLRLDRKLGDFFKYVDTKINLDKVLIVLSSDHGSTRMPEHSRRLGLEAGRFRENIKILSKKLNKVLNKKYGEKKLVETIFGGWIYYDMEIIKSNNISISEIDSILIKLIENEIWIEKVYSRKEIEEDNNLDNWGRMLKNHFHPIYSGDLAIVQKENYIYKGKYGTTHGSPHASDTHVPIIFAGFELSPTIQTDYVETVDVAPTIATILSVPIPIEVDGKALKLDLTKGE